MDAALAEAERAAADAAAALEGAGSSASHMKFLPFKYGMKVYTEQRLHFMTVLRDAGEAGGGGTGGGGGGGGGDDVSLDARASGGRTAGPGPETD